MVFAIVDFGAGSALLYRQFHEIMGKSGALTFLIVLVCTVLIVMPVYIFKLCKMILFRPGYFQKMKWS